VFFCFYFFLVFSLFKIYICSVFFFFCYNFVSFYLFINNLSSSFLIWNLLCCFKKISSLVSQVFFSTIFSFLKLVFARLQIARLHCFLRPVGVNRPWRDGWTDRRWDEWMERIISSRRPLLYVIISTLCFE
jgi:hypothetical protein